ncbi:MAG: acyl transferase domain-containing protein, partial [Enterobacterales bacterium]
MNNNVKNLSTTQPLAVIGIDAQFANELNIDRVERAFYQGNVSTNNGRQLKLDLATQCIDSVKRLAKENQLNSAEIDVVLINSQSQFANKLTDSFASLTIVSNLSDALTDATTKLQSGQNRQAKTVAILGVNQSSQLEPLADVKATITLDNSFEHYQEVEGIAAVLLSSEDFAARQSSYVYSVIKSFASSEANNSDVSKTISSSLELASITAEDIVLLEVSALADKEQSDAEVKGILDAYQSKQSLKLQTAISSARSVTGEGYGFSQVAGLLKTIISLQQQYISGINDWKGPSLENLEKWQSSAFYFPTEARPWYPNSNGSNHLAAYSCMTADSYCHLILEENQLESKVQDVRRNGYMACGNLSLILVTFNDENQIIHKLEELTNHCQNISNDGTYNDDNNDDNHDNNNEQTLNTLAAAYYENFKAEKKSDYRLILIAETAEDLHKEITLAKIGVLKALNEQSEWKTPKGSYFTAAPVGTEKNIAFFYPGIGATYVGLGRDLFHLFPEIYQPIAALADDIGATLKDTLLNPRSITALSFKELKQLDSDLRNSLANIA